MNTYSKINIKCERQNKTDIQLADFILNHSIRLENKDFMICQLIIKLLQ